MNDPSDVLASPSAATSERCRSTRVGLAIVSDRPVHEIAALAARAEVCGFTDIWLTDLQLARRDVYVGLAAIAAATFSVRLGPMVTNVSTRHLSVTATAIATLDEFSGGRAVCGIGAGRAAVQAIGRAPATLNECRAALETLRGLFAGEAVDLDGMTCRLDPFGHRPIPVMLAGSGPKMLQLAGESADGVVFITGASSALAQYAHENVARGVAKRHRPEAPAKVHYVPCLLPGAGAGARAKAEAIARFHASVLRIPGARDAVGVIGAGAPDPHLPPHTRDTTISEEVLDDFVVRGTHDEIADRAAALIAHGIDQLALWPVGDPHDFVESFADEVLPRLEKRGICVGS